MADSKLIRDPIVWARQRAAAARQRLEQAQASTPVQMFLPGMEAFMRAMPNPVARSSLFAPIARGRRRMHAGTVLVSRADAVLEYWGEQLDEADADICLQLMYEARKAPLGQPVTFNRAAFLRAIGRNTGKTQYEWFHRRMKALTMATLITEAKKADGSTKYHIGHTKAFHILSDFDYDEEAETYTYTVDPRWAVLFGNREYSLLDWDKRLQFKRGQDLAKSLQRLIVTSSDAVQRYSLDFLKERAQYSGRMRDFRETLTAAMRELERLEIIAGGRIECGTKGKEQAVWTRIQPCHA